MLNDRQQLGTTVISRGVARSMLPPPERSCSWTRRDAAGVPCRGRSS